MLAEIAKLPLGKTIHEDLVQAVARTIKERDILKASGEKLAALLEECKTHFTRLSTPSCDTTEPKLGERIAHALKLHNEIIK